MIIDTHAHLDHLEDLDEVLKRASDEGVEVIIAVSENLDASKRNLDISRNFSSPKIYVAIGIHPSEARIEELDNTVEYIKSNIGNIVAIGEIGLDFWYRWVRKNDDKKEEQKKVFRKMLEIAKENDLPAVIHSRGAWKHCLDIVKELGIKKAEFHWYSGPLDVLDSIIAEGYYISATPSLAYSSEAQEAVKIVPLEQLLIETDTPVYYKDRETGGGFKAEPKDVNGTLELLCGLKKLDKEEAAGVLNKNAVNFFNISI